ncbi:DUF4296 domain-containing protein [Flavobacterium sp. XGLA_31]|uniref:DUF4296 domain-containing protein n=1 Tax=Flavobacterium sp. XGLA_31 TaxID=3447666 RepID=UPI003F4008A4
MKKIITLFGLLFLIISCNSKGIEKPKNLIDKDKMVNILYDLSLLQAIKSQNVGGGIENKEANEYLFKKYNIDSIQLAESNKYYASDMEEYKKMYEEVKSRLEEETQKSGGATTTPSGTPVLSDAPQVQ